jgi:hypothetical protein
MVGSHSSPFLALVGELVRQRGFKISKDNLQKHLNTLLDFNPWIPRKGLLILSYDRRLYKMWKIKQNKRILNYTVGFGPI